MQTLLRRQGLFQKPALISALGMLNPTSLGDLIRGEGSWQELIVMGAPPSGNYMGPCCHLNLQGHFSDHKVEAARKASLQILPVEHLVYSYGKGAE